MGFIEAELKERYAVLFGDSLPLHYLCISNTSRRARDLYSAITYILFHGNVFSSSNVLQWSSDAQIRALNKQVL